MALFNKLFTNRRQGHNKHQDNVSDKFFAFTKDQVRVVLFRECDFRGRKLLFDSTSIKKVPVAYTKTGEVIKNPENEKFCEIYNGFGYVYTKPNPDFNQLCEMVFGSVAMSFRGSYFKMHSLEHPNRLMFTQVFSSPRSTNQQRRISLSSRSDPQNFEHSKLDDSGASSTNSMSEHSSVHSTVSDTVLVCRRPYSTPFDVPSPSSMSSSIPSLIGDSGYCADHSCNNISSGPPSFSTWGSINETTDSSALSLSSGSLYKKWLRRASTSLDNSRPSSPSHSGSFQDSRSPHRSSKLGLAFVLELTPGQEEEMSLFLMEHVALLEAMLWRARRVVELAYIKSQNFVSLMAEMASFSSQYLVNLLSGSHLSINLWLSLSSGCDNYNSINAFSASINDKTAPIVSEYDDVKDGNLCSLSTSFTSSETFKDSDSSDFQLFNLSKFLKTDPFNIKKNLFGENRVFTAEKFVQDFCELLEDIDIKDTKFFMSTLLTAVLTYHLGWVNTCLPSANENALQTRNPFNPLWGKFSDLYGAVGHPTKIAQTIVTGTNRKDLISRILITMTYFIRCCDVDRRDPIRADILEENKRVEIICNKTNCIPKENYKRYEDHLKEIMSSNKEFFADCENNNFRYCKPMREKQLPKKSPGLTRTLTCLENLSELGEEAKPKSLYPDLIPESFHLKQSVNNFKSFSKLRLQEDTSDYPSRDEIVKKVNTLCRVPSSAVHPVIEKTKSFVALDTLHKPQIIEMERQMKSNDYKEPIDTEISIGKKDVLFVLGDDDQLIGLKKTKVIEKQNKPEPSNRPIVKRPSFLDLSSQLLQMKEVEFQDSDFSENRNKGSVKPSTSWSQLAEKEKQTKETKTECSKASHSKKFTRSQSEPPEERQPPDHKSKSKFRYSGVKFNLQQYPQILSNYMKSKNLEISNLQFGEKHFKIDDLSSLSDTISSIYPELDESYEDEEALQTPSNASELEFTSDTFIAPPSSEKTINESVNATTKQKLMKELDHKTEFQASNRMKITNLPMPKSEFHKPVVNSISYTSSLMRPPSEDYIPDMVLQGSILPKQDWEPKLKSDLALASQHSFIDQHVEEAVAVIANTDTWEVQLMSSHTFIIDKGSSGIRIGMSQLVANMLESLLQMWKLKVPPHFCLIHIEQTLQELCVRSKALSELLLATEFCNMEQLTSTLQLEVNDVPLLLAVASTHSPQVTQKYGLSFQ